MPSKKPRVFVSGSAVGYYGIETGDRIAHRGRPAGTISSPSSVVDWESGRGRARERAGVRVSHPRIGLVLGRKGGMLCEDVARPSSAYVGGPVGTAHNTCRGSTRSTSVRALEHAARLPTLTGAFNVTAPEPVTMNAFAHALGEALGRPARLRVPGFAVKLAFGERGGGAAHRPARDPKRLVDTRLRVRLPGARPRRSQTSWPGPEETVPLGGERVLCVDSSWRSSSS